MNELALLSALMDQIDKKKVELKRLLTIARARAKDPELQVQPANIQPPKPTDH